jgi:uncharacterized protein YjbJ (UPF0337 family)
VVCRAPWALQLDRKELQVAKNVDEARGRAKEAAGGLTQNKRMKREGKIDRAAGEVKEKVGDASRKAKEATK